MGVDTTDYKTNLAMIDWSVKAKVPNPIVEKHDSKRGNFATPRIVSDYQAYECPVTGKIIEGRAAHAKNLKETGCRLSEPGEFEDVKKNGQKRINDRLNADIDRAVDEIAHTLDI